MNAIFVGEKRSGKTTLAFKLALDYPGGIIVFDPKKEFRGWPATVSSVPEMQMRMNDKHRVIIYRPAEHFESADTAFDELADWIMQRHAFALEQEWDKVGFGFTLLVDEAYNLQTHARINTKLMKILSECRPEILNVFQTFQSIKNVNSDSRSRVSDWFLFTITLPEDLNRLREFAMPEVIDIVQTLGEHEYVHFENEKGKQNIQVVTDSSTFDIPLDYSEEIYGNKEAKNMSEGREEKRWTPVQLEDERDFWALHDKLERRTRSAKDSGDRSRRSDRKNKDSGGDKEKSGKFLVFKAS
jgi:hypothetical protein